MAELGDRLLGPPQKNRLLELPRRQRTFARETVITVGAHRAPHVDAKQDDSHGLPSQPAAHAER
jgi:hypothetical protein